MPDDAAICLDRVGRSFPSGTGQVWAVREVSLTIGRGEAVAITGPSGSGKTTVLNLIGGLDHPSEGEVVVLGQRLNGLSEGKLTAFRAHSVGFVFQDPHLLPGLTALENVVVARLPWQPLRQLEPEARRLLVAVGLEHRLGFPPARLSGGERQRVGIARALLGDRPLLLADEPTGDLDAGTTEEILALIDDLREQQDLTLVVATHDPAVAAIANRVVRLTGGRLDGEHAIQSDAPVDVHRLD